MRPKHIHKLVSSLVAVAVMMIVFIPAPTHADQTAANGKPTIAFFGFRFINSSSLPPSKGEPNRIKLLDTSIKETLEASGLISVLPVSEEIFAEIAKEQHFGECQCEAKFGKRVGAKLMSWGTVEKISDVLLTIKIYIADVDTNQYKFVKNVNIRGNDDASWLRGLRWLLRYYLDDLK